MNPKTPPPGKDAPRVDPAEAASGGWTIVDARRREGGDVPEGSIPHEELAAKRKSLDPSIRLAFWCG